MTDSSPLPPTPAALVDRKHAIHLLHEMLRIRRFEEKCAELYQAEKIRGFLHLYIGIRDTPLSESAFVGAGIGAALGGMRPIVEIMTVNFSLLALDQILNNAATLRRLGVEIPEADYPQLASLDGAVAYLQAKG